ncbi:AsmA family protein [Marinobacter salinexigens]|uniref:AsmA family protein n=1 Tax=Marinobacter salinexigens TaxID=2919747 RepID=A0A5B0VPF0_9GAMM|nr:AsmA family protein [Marinobacter salinexigens]KAA1175881.1 AsmA family protein [Marinobacter salinexigens]
MKAVRYLLIAIIAVIVLVAAAIAIAMAVINPNDYKPQIEQAVEDQTNLDLILDGDIGWSFIPLGLELNNVEAKLEDKRFVALEQLVAEIDFWSLIAMSPQVNTFTLNGLEANLEVNEQGQGNWTRIMPESSSETKDGTDSSTGQSTGQSADTSSTSSSGSSDSGEALNFNVENVQIGNARIVYDDKSTGQSVILENFTVNASSISLDKEFPLEIGFRVETAKPKFEVDGSISARLAANKALNEFSASGLKAVFDMAGEPFGGKSVTAEISGSASANLENETASLKNFEASLANLVLTTTLDVKGFGDKPALSGNVAVAEFSLKKLLDSLGQAAIETTDPDVLKALAFSTDIGGSPGKIDLSNLTLKLDDTSFTGSGSYTLASTGIVFNLQGDKLNVDRYLPPASEEDETSTSTTSGSQTQTAQSSPESDLLPLDTLRTLLLDIDFGLGELIASNLTINEIKASTTAKNGVLKLDEFSGKMYEGSFGANATLDARTDNPKWAFGSNISSIQTLPLLTDLAEVDMLSGGANLKLNVSTTGNRISALRNNADGQISFNLAEGQLRGMNLTHLACQGIALVNQDSLTTTDWGTTTPFNDMHGTLDINGNILKNTDLVASLAGMKLEGTGTVDLSKTELDYEAGLRIVGEIHRDQACRVTDYVENVVIPVECRGNFSENAAGLCSFDGSRFRDTLKTIAANAAKAKAQEKVDEAKAKAEDKIKEKIGEELGDKLKGLFN